MAPTLVQLLLIISGLVLCVHMICSANFLPKEAPNLVGIVISLAFSAGVGIVVMAVSGDIKASMEFAVVALLLVLLEGLWLWSQGYTIVEVMKQKGRGNDTIAG